jgi:hypothetical protein
MSRPEDEFAIIARLKAARTRQASSAEEFSKLPMSARPQ